ncbi:MAG: hypothetical protein QMB59_03310, partial [Bacteroidales bacterium]
AAAEYPRQAEELTDLLNAYLNRSYLSSSVEGTYLLDLYKSTMEGSGLFSPNLQKARYYQSIGDAERCKDEILKHFFRSGNQGVYDCLLSDMTFCERNLKAGFDLIEPQDSLVRVKYAEGRRLFVLANDKELNVSLVNDSDVDLENVRVFLCIHYTDMYRDDYDVVKLPETKSTVVYGFNGHHLGWFDDGIVRDHDGYAVGFQKGALNKYTGYEGYKSYKQYKPYKSYREYAPYQPYDQSYFSNESLTIFLRRGI